jgi:hypothetical protein
MLGNKIKISIECQDREAWFKWLYDVSNALELEGYTLVKHKLWKRFLFFGRFLGYAKFYKPNPSLPDKEPK